MRAAHPQYPPFSSVSIDERRKILILEQLMSEQDRRIAETIEREQGRLRNFIRKRLLLGELFQGGVWLMPAIFGLGTITYWQALGLMALSWILFRGFRGPGSGQASWRYDMRRRWEKMTPAEREEFVKRQGPQQSVRRRVVARARAQSVIGRGEATSHPGR